MRVEDSEPLVEALEVSRQFGNRPVVDGVSLTVRPGEIRALLGPNGAGKTTLLRIMAGLLLPSSGSVSILGHDPGRSSRSLRRLVGLVPAGDRSFYLRISGMENLVFFARLHGLNRRHAVARSRDALSRVGLLDHAHKRVGLYSHGMQKRLSVARALLTEPPLLLVDEATHDLDPDGARRVRELVAECAGRAAAIVWATQRLDEVRSFADTATVLSAGRAVFDGAMNELVEHSIPRHYLLRLRNGQAPRSHIAALSQQALGTLGRITHAGAQESEQYLLALADQAVLGDALAALAGGRIQVLACRQERSEIEEAFTVLTGEQRA